MLAATPPDLFQVVTLLLRLRTVLTVAIHFLFELLLGSLDTPVTVASLIARVCACDTAYQQPGSEYGSEQNVPVTLNLVRHRFLLSDKMSVLGLVVSAQFRF
jgi:hypothetical protein